MRRWIACALLLCCLWGLTGCGQNAGGEQLESQIAGKSYVYEKDGFGGSFVIEIKDDGTFEYYEGALSSYIGIGNWELDGDTLILSDDTGSEAPRINRFRTDGEHLFFISEGSSNFIYVKAADGERFSVSEGKSV